MGFNPLHGAGWKSKHAPLLYKMQPTALAVGNY